MSNIIYTYISNKASNTGQEKHSFTIECMVSLLMNLGVQFIKI